MCGICGCDHQHDEQVHENSGAATHVPDLVHVEKSLFAHNQQHATSVRASLTAKQIFAINMVSSPGSGKTSLLVHTLPVIKSEYPCYVIEGDQQTSLDADRIAETQVPVKQINTGHACHLDAHRVEHALDDMAPESGALIFIENVGNLVCPANFDLGENKRVVLLSVTEGDDKPLKYPDIFVNSDLLLITKTDLLPFVDFDLDRCAQYARRICPDIEVIPLSIKSGQGVDEWHQWLRDNGRQATENAPVQAAG